MEITASLTRTPIATVMQRVKDGTFSFDEKPGTKAGLIGNIFS
jgi:hypothetical protein